MEILIRIFLFANLALSSWLLWRYLQLRRELGEAMRQIESFGAAAAATIGARVLPSRPGNPSISVAILNPMELAAKESSYARMFGSLAPELVRREVYKQVHQRLIVQLEAQGVVAEVTLHDDL